VNVKTPRIVAIIQARMGSTRLPGKVLMDIDGVPMLARVVERVRGAKLVNDVVVATSLDKADDEIALYCVRKGINHSRGSNEDVLSRYLDAAEEYQAEVIVRITADCPLMDPQIIDRTVGHFLSQEGVDFGSNRGKGAINRTFPIGMDVEVFTRVVLEKAGIEASQDYEREHVTPYFYEVPGRFRTVSIDSGGDFGHLRWTVDTKEDMKFVRQIYRRLNAKPDFNMKDVLDLLRKEPELAQINVQIRQKTSRDSG
jgi:spore coat polysaccharide biosynthesis protein SpsF